MSTVVEPVEVSTNSPPPIVYEPSEAAIAKWRAELAERIPDPVEAVKTPAGYELVRKAIGTLCSGRTSIEKKRVELKAGALAYGREVDGKAKHYTALIEEIERPLKEAKQLEDDRKKAEKRAAEEAEKARIAAEEKARRDAEEARLKAIRDAEEARLAAERERLAAERAKMEAERKAQEEARRAEQAKIEEQQRAERERIAAEQAALKAERDRQEAEKRKAEEAARLEREKLEAERRAIQAEKERLDRIEFERQAKEKAAAEAKKRAEREAQERAAAAERKRLEDERLAREKAEAQEAERKRQEEMRPDIERVQRYGDAIKSLVMPTVQSAKAKELLASVRDDLMVAANKCHNFGQRVLAMADAMLRERAKEAASS